MNLELRFFATFRAIVGQKVLEREFPEDATVGDVFRMLESEYPDMEGRLLDDEAAIREQLSVLKNGQEVVHMQGAETPMADDDRLSVFPPVAGGNDTHSEADTVDESATERIEKAYRGISKRLAVHYLENLGGELAAGEPEGSETAHVTADGWEAALSSEKVAIAGGTMKLTEVSVAFEGDPEVVPSLVEQFGQKAMRAGG